MRRRSRLAGMAGLLLVLVGTVSAALNGDLGSVIGGLSFLVVPVVAVVIARSRPDNAVAWVFGASAVLLGIEKTGEELAELGHRLGWPDPWVHLAVWFSTWAWMPGLLLLVTVAMLRFPDGVLLPGPLWRWTERVAYAAFTVWTLGVGTATATVPTRVLLSDATPDPTSFLGGVFRVGEAMFGVVGVVALLSIASLFVRHHRSGVVAREQIRWVLFAAVVALVIEVAIDAVGTANGDAATPTWVQSIGEALAFALIGVATAVAITRYKLYEIDRIVSRTVAYAVVLVVLGGVYLAVLLGLAAVLPTGVGQVGVAGATLAVAALAVPLTRRVRAMVDRRFHRSRFDAERVVAAFAAHLRARPAQGDVPTELVDVLRRTVQPSHAAVWLAPGSGSR